MTLTETPAGVERGLDHSGLSDMPMVDDDHHDFPDSHEVLGEYLVDS